MIQNWMNLEEICMMHTHHIAIDFQLSILGLILVGLIWKFPRTMKSLMVASVFGVLSLRFVRSYEENINVFVDPQVR
jgi:hypothetical protein